LVELALHRFNKRFVYDFDDAIYLPPPSGDTWVKRLMRADWRVGALSKRAALVSAGSATLAAYARQFTDRVEIWPTTISLAAYTERPEPPDNRVPVVGWSGSHTTARYIENLLPLLRELRTRVPFRIKIVGAAVDLGSLDGECVPWSPEIELPALHDMDVGLMPLDDIEVARGKCALKALQYSGVGVPAVVSDVGANREAVIDGETGYVVRSDSEWLEALERLLRDRMKRIQMGKAGREHVAKHYSAEVWVPRIAERLRGLAEP
jgi:glycosyltransferase involved in cell wall biosynthesis